MKLFNHIYESETLLYAFIKQHLQDKPENILIQMFSGELDESIVQNILHTLSIALPDAKVIGTSTSGEILDGKMQDNSISLSFAVFENTKIKTYYAPIVDFDSGKKMAEDIMEPNTKAIISFSESLKSDPPSFFKGFESINNEVIIAGGNAGDNENFKKTFVIKDNHIYFEGIVLCTLVSESLLVHNDYTLNWTPIGSELTITKAQGNIVSEINNQPILEIYKYYFGDDIEKDLPNSIVDFPLIKNENGIDIARSLLMLLEDQSFFYAGQFSVGDKVRFAIGNVNEVLENAHNFSQEVSKKSSEGIFVYSCSVRRNFLKSELENEFKLLNTIAPCSGFLTYGEFYNTGKSNQVLNITTTILSLSEVDKENSLEDDSNHKKFIHSPLTSMVNLVNVTQRELENKIQLLEETQSQLIEAEKMASLGALVAGVAHEVNTPLGVGISGISQVDFEVKKLDKSFHEGSLTEEDFEKYISIMKTLSQTIHSGLENAADLVKSFKNISVDQHSNDVRIFNLHTYLDNIVVSLNNTTKAKSVTIVNTIDENLTLESYAGAYSQIFSNLILNSFHHAFENGNNNEITISTRTKNGATYLDYKDNGKGITDEVSKKIFDPFFTTARGQGGSGLGMNVVYNIVKQKLGGEIKVIQKENAGFHLEILINPKEIKADNNG